MHFLQYLRIIRALCVFTFAILYIFKYKIHQGVEKIDTLSSKAHFIQAFDE